MKKYPQNVVLFLAKRLFLALLSLFIVVNTTFASGANEEDGKFDPGSMIMHHIADSHEWHFATIGHSHITLPLPIILYSSDRGLEMFSSSKFYNAEHQLDEYNGYKLDHDHIEPTEEGRSVLDFSITKNVASMFISVALLIGIFLTIAKAYKNNEGKAPKGVQSFFEPIITFVIDDIAKPNIGPKYQKYLPYLLTVFFFIWFNNLLGLLPGGANLSGNIAVTLALAFATFLVTIFSGNKNYWVHILWTPGVPLWLRPLMIVVEVAGIFTKPVSLMIRLFANITAGHIIILSLFSLIFIFKSFAIGPVSVAFAIFMNCLELFVALLQAYVFTLLSAMYIGGAVEEHHHEHAGAEHH
jgi:F-type H+-transporting ATPase subunit a